MKILVTGQAGSGKSSVAAELQRRGFASYDTDAMEGVTGFFVLVPDRETLAERLRTRTNNAFDDRAEAEAVLAHNDVIADEWRVLGGIPIDASRPLEAIVDEIVSRLG